MAVIVGAVAGRAADRAEAAPVWAAEAVKDSSAKATTNEAKHTGANSHCFRMRIQGGAGTERRCPVPGAEC